MIQTELCGVRIDGVTLEEALEFSLMEHDGACTVVTPNALMLERCRRERGLAELFNRATLSLPDGAGVLRAAKKQGIQLPERVAGIACGEALLARASALGLRVCFLGGAEGIANEAASVASAEYLRCVQRLFRPYGGRKRAADQAIAEACPRRFICLLWVSLTGAMDLSKRGALAHGTRCGGAWREP